MKVLILAGGYGTRLHEETDIRPKPMVEIGGWPILWHIMKIYSHAGFNEFVILLGYKGYIIKEFFANYYIQQSDMTFDLSKNNMKIHNTIAEPWLVTPLDTGLDTMTGGRVKRARDFIGNDTFMLTYGDGVADINVRDLLKFHRSHGRAITMTSVQPEGRFGVCDIESDNRVSRFLEKPRESGAWINGGFFVCEPKVLDYIGGDRTTWEREPLQTLAEEGELFTYKHSGFWKCMDTLRDKLYLNQMWNENRAQWKMWGE